MGKSYPKQSATPEKTPSQPEHTAAEPASYLSFEPEQGDVFADSSALALAMSAYSPPTAPPADDPTTPFWARDLLAPFKQERPDPRLRATDAYLSGVRDPHTQLQTDAALESATFPGYSTSVNSTGHDGAHPDHLERETRARQWLEGTALEQDQHVRRLTATRERQIRRVSALDSIIVKIEAGQSGEGFIDQSLLKSLPPGPSTQPKLAALRKMREDALREVEATRDQITKHTDQAAQARKHMESLTGTGTHSDAAARLRGIRVGDTSVDDAVAPAQLVAFESSERRFGSQVGEGSLVFNGSSENVRHMQDGSEQRTGIKGSLDATKGTGQLSYASNKRQLNGDIAPQTSTATVDLTKGVKVDIGRAETPKADGSPHARTSKSTVNITKDSQAIQRGFNRDVDNGDGSVTRREVNLGVVSGKDGKGITFGGDHGIESKDPTTGATLKQGGSASGMLTTKKAALNYDYSKSRGGPGTYPSEKKVSPSGSYSADISWDSTQRKWKLVVTLDLGLAMSLSKGSRTGSNDDGLGNSFRNRGSVKMSAGAAVTAKLTRTRFLTDAEKKTYLKALSDADKTADRGKSSRQIANAGKCKEVDKLAHARAGLSELGNMGTDATDIEQAKTLASGDSISLVTSLAGNMGLDISGAGVGGGYARSRKKTRTLTITKVAGTAAKPGDRVVVSVAFGEEGSDAFKGTGSVAGTEVGLTTTDTSTGSSGSTFTLLVDAKGYDTAYNDITQARSLAELEKYKHLQSGFDETEGDSTSLGVTGKIFGGLLSFGSTGSDGGSTSIKARDNKLDGSKVNGHTKADATLGMLGDVVKITGSQKHAFDAELEADGEVKASLTKETEEGWSAMGGLMGETKKLLTEIRLDAAHVRALAGRASDEDQWMKRATDLRTIDAWKSLGRSLRSPRPDPRAHAVNPDQARQLARVQAVATYVRETGSVGRVSLVKALRYWNEGDGGDSDLGVGIEWTGALAAHRDTYDSLKGRVAALPKTVAAMHSGTGAPSSMKLQEEVTLLTQDIAKIQRAVCGASEMNARNRMETLESLSSYRRQTADIFRAALNAPASWDKWIAEGNDRSVFSDQLQMLQSAHSDERRLFANAIGVFDGFFSTPVHMLDSLAPFRELHDKMSSEYDELVLLAATVGKKAKAVEQLRPRTDLVESLSRAASASTNDDRQALLLPVRDHIAKKS